MRPSHVIGKGNIRKTHPSRKARSVTEDLSLVFLILVKMVLIIGAIDVILTYAIWRIKIINGRVEKRINRMQAEATSKNDIWFSDKNQEELYSDFK